MNRLRRRLARLVPLSLTLPITLAQARGGRGTVRLYRANGRYAGRIEANGRYYGENGRYLGRVEGNRIYSAQGRYLGRFEESGAFHDASEAPLGMSSSGASQGSDQRAGPVAPGIGPARPPITSDVRPPFADGTPGAVSPHTSASALAGTGSEPPIPAHPHPSTASGSHPTAGQPIIEIVRPERGPR